ncbi:hypothetical protein K2W90_04170 [Candidatus Babeliales bacterium]|nr:hypothetical protein [Candidatus Babeliales bacterium]
MTSRKHLTRTLVFLLSISVGFNVTNAAAATETAPASASFSQMPMNFDPEELHKMLVQLLVQHRQNIADRKQAMFELLPEDLRANIMEATDTYGALIEQLSISNKLMMVCQDVDSLLEQAYKEGVIGQEEVTGLVAGLQSLEQALINGQLNGLIRGSAENDLGMNLEAMANPAGVFGLKSPAVVYTYEDVAEFKEQLALVVDLCTITPSLEYGLEDVVFLRDILDVIANKDSDALIDRVLEPLRSQFQLAGGLFDNVIRKLTVLEKEVIAQEAGQPEESQEISSKNIITLKRAVTVWKRDLQKFAVNIRSFMKVWDSADLKVSSKSKHELFKCVAYTYDACRSFFNLYKEEMYWDKNISFFKKAHRKAFERPTLSDNFKEWTERMLPLYTFDWSVSGALSLWHFFNARSDYAKGNLLNVVLGSQAGQGNLLQELMGGDSLIDVKNELIQNLFAGYGAMRILTSSNVSCLYKQPSKVVKAMGKVLVAFTYYQLIYDKPRSEKVWWPSDYEHIRRHVFVAVRELSDIMTEALEVKIYEHADPRVIENLEKNTWGVVRPELLTLMTRIMLPVAFMKKPFGLDNVANCDQWDVYGKWYIHMRDHYIDLFQSKEDKKAWLEYDAAGIQQVFDRNNINVESYYVEQQLMNYVFSSIGKHWGTILGRKHGGALVRMASKVANGCAYGLSSVGLISDEAVQVFEQSKDEMIAEWNGYVDMLKEFLKVNFAGIREWATPYLVEHGYLDQDETTIEVRDKAVLSFGLTQLAKNGLISYYEAALLVQNFSADSNISIIVDQVVDAVRRNIAGKVGGVAGSTMMSALSDYVSWTYGPFTPKVTEYARNNVPSLSELKEGAERYASKVWNSI